MSGSICTALMATLDEMAEVYRQRGGEVEIRKNEITGQPELYVTFPRVLTHIEIKQVIDIPKEGNND